MSGARLAVLALVGVVLLPRIASADGEDDRLALSANGSSLSNGSSTGSTGGGGASAGWLHNFDADTLITAAVEHQALSVSHWSFGSLSGALSQDFGSNQRYTFSGEVHAGAGDDGPHFFDYNIEAIGVSGTYFHKVTVQVEDRQVDVEKTHGNMPKLGVAYVWNNHVQTAIGYQYSLGGNLGTRLASGRIDFLTSRVNFLAGGAFGQASPTILGVELVIPASHLKEGYVGLSKSLPRLRSEITLIADYLRISGGTGVSGPQNLGFTVPGDTRWTGTLNYIFHFGNHGH